MRTVGLVVFLLVQSGGVAMSQAASGKFEGIGTPITRASLLGYVAGPGPSGGAALYMSFHHTSRVGFLLAVDANTGKSNRYVFPVESEQGAWGITLGRGGKVYLGTHWNAHLLRFDPTKEALDMIDLEFTEDSEELVRAAPREYRDHLNSFPR